MSEYISLLSSKSTAIFKASPTTNDHSSARVLFSAGDALLVGFPTLDAAYRKRRINYVSLHFAKYPVDEAGNADFHLVDNWTNAANFTQSTVTYATAPERLYQGEGAAYMEPYYMESWRIPEQARTALLYGVRLDVLKSCTLETSRGTNAPYLGVSLSDEDIGLTPYGNPSSGYISKHTAQTFSWSNAGQYDAYTEQTQTAAVFHWRNGTSGSWTTQSLTTGTSVTLASGSLTGDTMQWYVTVTSSSGVVTDSPIYTLSTAEAESTAQIIAPTGTIVDGQQPIVLSWAHEISTGTAQTAADIEYSTNGSTWTGLASVTGPAQEYTVSAGTLQPGTCFWRVRTYNQDSTAGAWSESAQIVVVAPSGAPNVAVSASPLPVVTWLAQGQEGWQAQIGDYDSGRMFGTETTWQPPDFLPDGQYTARVRVVNRYGIWSEWGGAVFTVANTSGTDVSLTAAVNGGTVALEWTATGYDYFVIYRDGVRIGRTTANAFNDVYTPAGEHRYQVRGVVASTGMYGMSETVTANAAFEAVYITDTETGTQYTARYVLKNNLPIATQATQDVSFTFYSGSAKPSAEIGESVTFQYTFAPVFPNSENEVLESIKRLLSHVIHIKDRYGTSFFSVFNAYSVSNRPTYKILSMKMVETDYEVGT